MFLARGAEHRALLPLAERLARELSIPFALKVEPAAQEAAAALLDAGAARLVIETSALRDPDLVSLLARSRGFETIGVWITGRREGEHYRVVHGEGGESTEWDPVTWAAVVEAQGGGQVILETPDGGPHGEPYDLELLGAVSAAVKRPVIAAGEAAGVEDLFDALMVGDADGVVVGTLLHSGGQTVGAIKSYLEEHGLPVRR